MSRRGRGEGSIYRRQDGTWVGTIELEADGGIRRRRYVYGKTRGEVVTRQRDALGLASKGVQPAPERLTVEAYLHEWVTERVPGTVAVRTAHLYAHAVERYLVPTLGHRRLTKLSPTDVSRLLARLEEQGYSPSTRRMARATLRRALRAAEQEGLVERNVAAIAEGPRVPRREGRTLTPEQARTFIAAVRGERLEAAYVLALTLGLRRGEVLGLRWSDLEVRGDDLLAHVRLQLLRDHEGVRLAELKTAGSRRSLPLSRPAIEALERHRVRQEAEEIVRGARWRNDAELIFTSTIGTPLDPEAFGRTVPKITTAAGLGHWSIHELRHSCASLLLAMEVPLEVVADQLGHSSIRVTKDVYGHLLPGARAKAAEAMRRVIEGDDDASSGTLAAPLAASLAAWRAAKDVSTPLISEFVGRPGLDPGTLGLKVAAGPSLAFCSFHLACSDGVSSSSTFAEVRPCRPME